MNRTDYENAVGRIATVRQRSYDSTMLDTRDRVKTLTTALYETLDIIQLLLKDVLVEPNTFSIPESTQAISYNPPQ